MQEQDCEAVYQMNLDYFSESWSLHQIKQIIRDETMLYVVAQMDGQLVGYCGLYQVLDEGNITQVAVQKAMRGQGIATEMLKYMLQLAMQRDMNFFTLEVRASNESAIRLYESAGFVEQGRRKNYYKEPTEDGIIMNKM